jgi:hypothetical protein
MFIYISKPVPKILTDNPMNTEIDKLLPDKTPSPKMRTLYVVVLKHSHPSSQAVCPPKAYISSLSSTSTVLAEVFHNFPTILYTAAFINFDQISPDSELTRISFTGEFTDILNLMLASQCTKMVIEFNNKNHTACIDQVREEIPLIIPKGVLFDQTQ